jgi:hypothetical protein
MEPTVEAHTWTQCAKYAVKRAQELYRRSKEVEAMAADYLARCIQIDSKYREARELITELEAMVEYFRTFHPKEVEDAMNGGARRLMRLNKLKRRREAYRATRIGAAT